MCSLYAAPVINCQEQSADFIIVCALGGEQGVQSFVNISLTFFLYNLPMLEESLTDTFETAKDEMVADNINAAPSGEQVALNLHDVITRMHVSPEAVVGLCNALGQASCLLSSNQIPEDSLRNQFQMSVDDMRTAGQAQPDNINGQPAMTRQMTFG